MTKSINISAGQRQKLTNENAFIKILSGTAEIYAVTRDKNKFRQIFLVKLEAGEAVFPAMDDFGEVDTEIYAMSDIQAEEIPFKEIDPENFINLTLGWFEKLITVPWIGQQVNKDDVLTAWQNRKVYEEIGDLTAIFRENQQIFAMLLGVWFRSEDKLSEERQKMRVRQKKRLIDSSIDALLNENHIFYEETGDSQRYKTADNAAFILRCAQKALRLPDTNVNISIDTAKKLDSATLLKRMAAKGNIALRFVTLEKDWHNKDCGVIIGYYGKNKEIAAFLPATPNSYKMITATAPEGIAITEDKAKNIDKRAFVCYAGLPRKKLETSDLRKFIVGQCWREDFKRIILTSVFAGLIPLTIPLMTETIFKDILPVGDKYGLIIAAQILFAAGFSTAALSIVRSVASNRISVKAEMATEAALWSRLLTLPDKFFRRFTTSELMNRMGSVEAIKNIINDNFVLAISGIIFSFWCFLLMFWYSPKLTLTTMAVFAPVSLIELFFFQRVVYMQKKFNVAKWTFMGVIRQIFLGLSQFRIRGAEEAAYNLWGKNFAKIFNYGLSINKVENYISIIGAVQPFILAILIYYMATNPAMGVSMEFYEFIAFEAACASLNAVLISDIPIIAKYFGLKAHLDNLLPILEEIPETTEDKVETESLTGAFEVSHLTFSYKEGEDVLKDVSFSVKAGENVAIVGSSGCGKSTLVKLLLGFEKPKSGAILYDGQSLEDISPVSIRSQMGVVLQNGKLMTGDIFSNIAGQGALTEKDAWRAAKDAGIAEDIKEMPMGMQTIINENGLNLSGGQRQRLMIARALAIKPAILIFDEATSALDNNTQALVSQNIDKLKITRIIIAHRLSTVRNANRIIVLDNGRITEIGTFEELMAKDGFFAKLAKNQIE